MQDARVMTLDLRLVLALAFHEHRWLLMLAFDFASYGENVEAREVASKPLRTSRGDQEISPLSGRQEPTASCEGCTLFVVAAALDVAIGSMPWISLLPRLAIVAIGGAWLLDVFRDAPASRDVGRVGRLAGAARELRVERQLPATKLLFD
jgi:hypothetical protein